jgi:hypothetical protein
MLASIRHWVGAGNSRREGVLGKRRNLPISSRHCRRCGVAPIRPLNSVSPSSISVSEKSTQSQVIAQTFWGGESARRTSVLRMVEWMLVKFDHETFAYLLRLIKTPARDLEEAHPACDSLR